MPLVRFMNFVSICFLLIFCGCMAHRRMPQESQLASIHFIDHNGLAETISSRDRLAAYEKADFLGSQPYAKIRRDYTRDAEGKSASQLTTYHPNGQIKQYLEVEDNRAHGVYKEWFASGCPKVEGTVVGGIAELNPAAQESWLFDGPCSAWNEDGTLAAEIVYCKGALDGESRYYHRNGCLWKKVHYEKGLIHGRTEVFYDDGKVFFTGNFCKGCQEGPAMRLWPDGSTTAQEHYIDGRLIAGQYFDKQGKETSKIQNGNGFKSIFGKNVLSEKHEYRNGIQEGLVQLHGPNGVMRTYYIKDDLKEGLETVFRSDKKGENIPMLLVNWHEGLIQGEVKSWYDNGVQESSREMYQNKKHGISMAWYKDGNLMLIEEYDRDKLVRGQYIKKGFKGSISEVEEGKGMATLYDGDGNFLRKVEYDNGHPML